jgi:hypothetical protein
MNILDFSGMQLLHKMKIVFFLGGRVLGKCCIPHTKEAHESYLMSKTLISRLAGREKKAQQLFSVGLDLSSIWEKARALGTDKERWQEIRDSEVLFCKG